MKKTAHKVWERLTAFLLVICMALGATLGQAGITAYASTELREEDLGTYGASEATAWYWKSGTVTGQNGAFSGSSYRFDLRGLSAGESSYNDASIKTTYSNGGYASVIQVDSGSKHGVGGSTNGGVQTVDNVEVKIAVSASKDNQYIIVDYYVYNTENDTKSVKLGTGTDVMIGGSREDDYATIYLTDRGFHMVNQYVYTVFDCITNDESLGVTPPDTRWIGHYNSWGTNVFNSSTATSVSNTDSGMAYSWNITLRPYETVHKRIAFAVRDQSYYVSYENGTDGTSTEGTYSDPFKTIQYAVNKIGNAKGYIYVMDYPEMNSVLTLGNGSNMDITIASTDYDSNGSAVSDIKTLKRDSNYTGSLFEVTSGTVKLVNITLDGAEIESSAPLISVTGGTLEINSGARITNAKGNSESTGSAVSVTGTGGLSMNMGAVTGNVSNGKGTIYYDGTGGFSVINGNQVTDNATSAGAASNVYLTEGKTITVEGDLDDSVIGVTTAEIPQASAGVSEAAEQEVVVAVPSEDYPGLVEGAYCLFAENFQADQQAQGLYIEGGTEAFGNYSNAVLKRSGYTVTIVYVDADTGGTPDGASTPSPSYYAAGETVNLEKPAEISGYELTAIDISPTDAGLAAATGDDFGKVNGTMPASDVTITYTFTGKGVSISFVTNGGSPEIEPITGKVGESVNASLPNLSRYGYRFIGWETEDGTTVTELPSVFPQESVTYYAIFEPDTSVTFDYTVAYTNEAGNLVFDSATSEDAYSVKDDISAEAKSVPGYQIKTGDAGHTTTPETYDFDGDGTAEEIGSFDCNDNHKFTGKMPAQDTTVQYIYEVDRTGNGYPFTVKHVTESGTTVSASASSQKYPEDAITASPVDVYGYTYKEGTITKGNEANAEQLIVAASGSFANDGTFTGTMPNQEVEITYIYEPTSEQYEFRVQYEDDDTQDELLKQIREPDVDNTKKADDPVEATAPDFYGYQLDSHETVPNGVGSYDGTARAYTANMPNEDLTVTFHYNRESSKWADLTYKAEADTHGQLVGNPMSDDVRANNDGTYTASVLINDSSADGQAYSYTWQDIQDRNLLPSVQADRYYRLAGWFVDTNGNDIFDNDETLLPTDYRFTGSATVLAHFEEDPEQWVDIYYEAGEHGSLDASGPAIGHYPYDTTWEDIISSLPAGTPEVNYLIDGWYHGNVPMEADDLLTNGATYTLRFKQDPAVFGTDVATPDVLPGIGDDGKGQVTVYGTAEVYQYIIVDMDGIVVDVIRQDPEDLPGRVIFEGLYPGTRYEVYEAAGSVTVQPGQAIGEVSGPISDPAEAIVPVVETNYEILYDEDHDGKTVLVIEPADPDSDYALLDKDGNVVMTGQTEDDGWQTPDGNPACVTFPGLDYNEEYTVVARPKGQADMTPESKEEYGTVIVTDPGGQLDIPEYVVETIGGVVYSVEGEVLETSRYGQAHKGDTVVILAEEENDDGQDFLYWEITIGSISGLGNVIRDREVTFTMPDTNVVLTARYERGPSDNARVEDEVRGGNEREIALDPAEVKNLEEELTTDEDRELIRENGAEVTYKVVYRKGAVRATDSNAIKDSDYYEAYYEDHEDAYQEAWKLDVSLERYVNGRKVGVASPSDATFNTYVQLDSEDVDMMDYHLFSLTKDEDDGTWLVAEVIMSDDPEETGGLFTFEAQAGVSYVLVYSKAYRLYFINNKEDPRYRYSFKVRRGESPGDADYEDAYGQVEEPQRTLVDEYGVEYTYICWSYKENRKDEFDPDKKMTRNTEVFAYYEDNSKEVADAREALEEAIREAIGMSDDYFLLVSETKALEEAIEEALEVFYRTGSTLEELLDAIERLEEICAPLEEKLDERYKDYDRIQGDSNSGGTHSGDGWGSGSSSSGGGSGGGGGGSGSSSRGPVSTPGPYVAETSKSYVVGTNGNWELVDAASHQWAFVLNGGIRLTSIWAHLDYANGDVSRTGWYHFNANGLMDSGWFRDELQDWYYCNTEHDGWFGLMKTGWHHDLEDGRWYYLDPASGRMVTGWRQIDGKWYYFTEYNTKATYEFDRAAGQWVYLQNDERPYGSMYSDEATPDGYQVGPDGAMLQ